ncbi:MAG: hypothetical protein JST86_20420 [Bacteroidetes bacterium]|nr:hypothetical protein [Bacteroidota bacterium]
MKASTVNEIKQELQHLPAAKLTELCLRLAKFKKENKELLTYLLFESHDRENYIAGIKEEVDGYIGEMNKNNVYFMKKTLRKILRQVTKYIRYSGEAAVEIELLVYFCHAMKQLPVAIPANPVLYNMYNAQLKKINKAIHSLHEDLQYDYQKLLNQL